MRRSTLLDYVFKSFERKKEEFPGVASLTNGSWLGNIKDSNWLELYNTNPRLAVVHKIAEDNGATKFSLIASTNKSKYYVTDHPLELAIKEHTVPKFFSLWTAYRLMTGVVYICYDIVDGQPSDLRLFTTNHMAKTTSNANEYTFSLGDGTVKTYPKEQVIIDMDLDLKNPYTSGKGKAEAIKDEIETDEFVQKYIKMFYTNSARPDLYITAGGETEFDEADINRLESEWNRKFQGITNAHKPAFLNWDAKVFSVANNHRDMELLETRKFYRDTSIQHFGVPPEIMGIVENSNKATVIAAEHIYAKQVRMPKLAHMEDIINAYLLPKFKDSQRVTFKFDNILEDDVEMSLQIANAGITNRTMIVNEWRTMMGLPKIKGDYGNSIVGVGQSTSGGTSEGGQAIGGGTFTPFVVEVEDQNLASKKYKEYASEEFRERASNQIGKELDNELIIIREGEIENGNDT